MTRYFLRRFVAIPFALVLINFIGFAFAHVTFQLQQAQTVFGSGREGFTPVWPVYIAYLERASQGDFGQMPIGVNNNILDAVLAATGASLGLLGVAFLLSLALGLGIGLASVIVNPPRTRPWLTVASTLGLAMPSFYIGTLLVGGVLLLSLNTGNGTILPVAGFGWGAHMVLPILALIIRPTMQVAQVTGSLLAGELGKRYVVAARSFGHTWETIRWQKAFKNILAPVIITVAGSFRILVAELVLVEWLFSWPGIGRLLVQTLVPPRVSTLGGLSDTSVFFLNPPLVAALLVVFAMIFLLADILASGLARMIDPRMRLAEEEAFNG
jgi:ABC-type dipeptide/oligopeptide/nickel transport system permease component